MQGGGASGIECARFWSIASAPRPAVTERLSQLSFHSRMQRTFFGTSGAELAGQAIAGVLGGETNNTDLIVRWGKIGDERGFEIVFRPPEPVH